METRRAGELCFFCALLAFPPGEAVTVDVPKLQTRGLSNSDGLRLLIFPQPLGEALKNQNAAPTTPPCFCRRQWSSSLHWADCLRCFAPPPCSNPPACVSLLFVQKKNARVFLHKRSLGGRGWIARAAHLKKPLRGFFAAGTYGGGRCCSNPPATIPLICFYKTETPAPGSDAGVLGGRGWIARAAHLKKPLRGFFAAGTDGGGRCCSNPPATIPLMCFYKTETPVPGSDTGVLGGAKQPKSEPLPSGASLAAISSKVMVFVPSL